MPTGLLPVWLGLRSKGRNEFTSILLSLPVRSGPKHDTGATPTARIFSCRDAPSKSGSPIPEVLLTDRSKPVSARRGLPTLTLPAQPETAFDDKRSKEPADSGVLVIA